MESKFVNKPVVFTLLGLVILLIALLVSSNYKPVVPVVDCQPTSSLALDQAIQEISRLKKQITELETPVVVEKEVESIAEIVDSAEQYRQELMELRARLLNK